jgi:hypothetical protein
MRFLWLFPSKEEEVEEVEVKAILLRSFIV